MVEVCDICGDRGFSNALLDCSECSSSSAHQYCLGIPPGSIDDTFYWVCECCSVPMESESCQFGGALSLGASQSCSGDLKIESGSEIVALPKPLCMLSPIQYHGSSTRDKTTSSSQKDEAAISSFMEHPYSIMRGIVLLVSPSGEVFVDVEKSSCESLYLFSLAGQNLNMTRLSTNPGTYKVKRESSPLGKTMESYVGSTGTMELDDLKLESISEVDGFENDDDPILSVSSIRDVEVLEYELAILENKCGSGRLRKSFDCHEENEATAHIVGNAEVWSNDSVGSSMTDLRKGMLKRTFEPEVEVIQQKKATVHKILRDAEGPSTEPLRISKEKNKLIKQQTDDCMMKFDRNRELSIGTSLAQTQISVRNQIVTMLVSAGWTVEYRPRKTEKRARGDRVYVSPQGTAYWSIPRAYRKLEKDFEKAKAKKSELGDGSDNSNFCFKPLSKELLSLLSCRDRLFNKK